MSDIELHQAVQDLTQPQHVRLTRDTGEHQWVTTPSLWRQLTSAAGTGREGPSSHNKWILPIDPDALDLRLEIIETTTDALLSHDQEPRADLPASLRLLAATVISTHDQDLTQWWTYRLRSWTNRTRHVLGLNEQPQPRRIRDTPCPNCGNTQVVTTIDGEQTRVPPLVIDFDQQMVRAISCTACGQAWFRGDQLLQLADTLNNTAC